MNMTYAELKIAPEILVDFFGRLAERLNREDRLIEAEVIRESYTREALKIRLTTEHAAIITPEEGGRLTGEVVGMERGEWAYCGNEPLTFKCPPIDFTKHVPIEVVEAVAAAIDERVEDYRDENFERQGGECVKEYFTLARDIQNPVYEGNESGSVWQRERVLNEGRIFVVSRQAGKPARLYPPGYAHDVLEQGQAAYTAVRRNLIYTPCPFRAVLLEEGGDAVSILEEFVRRDIISYEDIFSLVGY